MVQSDEPLSERETEILRLVATGASNKEIATRLMISPNTVKVHLRNIFAKINVVSRTEATLYALRHGIVTQEILSPPGSPDAPSPNSGSPLSLIETSAPVEKPEPARRRAPAIRWALPGVLLVVILAAAYHFLGGHVRTQPQPTLVPPLLMSTLPPRWQMHTALPARLSAMAAAVYEGRIYLIGGATGQGVSGEVWVSSPNADQWNQRNPKPTAVSAIQAAIIGERIFVPGGLTASGSPTALLEVYDPRADRWERGKSLPQPLARYALVAFEGSLYLFGGWNGLEIVSNVYRYNPETDQWQERTPLPEGRILAGAVVQEGRILIVGGESPHGALSSVLAYYPNREGTGETPWEEAPSLPEARRGMAAASIASTVYVMGGENPDDPTAFLPPLALNPDSDAWMSLENSGWEVGSQAAMLPVGNFLHILGGFVQGTPSNGHFTYQALYTVAIPLLSNDSQSEEKPGP
jgi:DNA-binding CsgD family transcriptional regulator